MVAGLVAKPLFWVIFVGAGFALPIVRSVARGAPTLPGVVAPAPGFTLVDQRGKPFSSGDLLGKVWVVDFVTMGESERSDALTKAMAKLRFRTRNLGHSFHLVTMTLDPARDGDAARNAYAEKYHASPATWSFLGGSTQAVDAVLRGFQLSSDPTPGIVELARRERLALVDAAGKIRGWYATDPGTLDALVADIGMLANDPGG